MFHVSGYMIHDRRGFTMIELLVTVATIALLASYMLLYTSKSRNQIALYVQESKIVRILSRSKSLAIATYNSPDVPCGYGVRIKYAENAYALYRYNASDCANIASIDVGSSDYQEIQVFPLPANIVFENGVEAMDTVIFIPPDPKTRIWSGGLPFTAVQGNVYLRTVDGSARVTVSVTPAGQISF